MTEFTCPMCQLPVDKSHHYCFNCKNKAHAYCDFLDIPVERFGSPTLCKTFFYSNETLSLYAEDENGQMVPLSNNPSELTDPPVTIIENRSVQPRSKTMKLDAWVIPANRPTNVNTHVLIDEPSTQVKTRVRAAWYK